MKQWWIWLLTQLYKLLIVRVHMLDKETIREYDRLKTLGVVKLDTNQGPVTFIFKEDRRGVDRTHGGSLLSIKSYFVEMDCPEKMKEFSVLHKKAILVVKLKIKQTNYDALGNLLLHTYLDALLK